MELIYGVNSIRDLLRQQKNGWEKILIASGRTGPSVQEIIAMAGENNIPVEFCHRKKLDNLAGTSDNQGIVAFRPPFVYKDLDVLIKNRNSSSGYDLILVLDSIVDPQNLGSIIRSAHCWGANGVVIPEDRSANVTAAVNKASAGSVQQIPVARVVNLAQSLEYLKEKGFWVFGAETHQGKSLGDMDFQCSVVLVMGSEAKGIRPLVRKKCDFLVTIPLPGHFDSLNVSVAAGIILYEIFRQRMKSDKINGQQTGL